MEIIKQAEIPEDFPVYDQGRIAENIFFGGHIFIKKRRLGIDSRVVLSSITLLMSGVHLKILDTKFYGKNRLKIFDQRVSGRNF